MEKDGDLLGDLVVDKWEEERGAERGRGGDFGRLFLGQSLKKLPIGMRREK